MLNLVKKPNEWIVTHVVSNEIVYDKFKTIELAADFMEKLGANNEDIDTALCELAAYDHVRALFTNKGFSHTEEK